MDDQFETEEGQGEQRQADSKPPETAQQFRAVISASNFFRREACPGSRKAEEGMPEGTNTNAARTIGVMLHAREFSGITENLTNSHKWALERNRRNTEKFIARTFESLGISDPGEPTEFREREFFLNYADGTPVHPAIPGHTDQIIWYPQCRIIFVFDSKFGRIPVPNAENNWQLKVYFSMIADEFEFDKCYCAIRQPFLLEPFNFHAAYYDYADKEKVRTELLNVVKACYEPDARQRVTLHGCAYCKARATGRCKPSMDYLRTLENYQLRSMEPHKLEDLAERVEIAKGICRAWEDRMYLIAKQYPALLRKFGLSNQAYDRRIKAPVTAFEVLYRAGKIKGNTELEALKDYVNKVCTASFPKLCDYVTTENEDGRVVVPKILGADEDDGTGLSVIAATPKKRSLVRLRLSS